MILDSYNEVPMRRWKGFLGTEEIVLFDDGGELDGSIWKIGTAWANEKGVPSSHYESATLTLCLYPLDSKPSLYENTYATISLKLEQCYFLKDSSQRGTCLLLFWESEPIVNGIRHTSPIGGMTLSFLPLKWTSFATQSHHFIGKIASVRYLQMPLNTWINHVGSDKICIVKDDNQPDTLWSIVDLRMQSTLGATTFRYETNLDLQVTPCQKILEHQGHVVLSTRFDLLYFMYISEYPGTGTLYFFDKDPISDEQHVGSMTGSCRVQFFPANWKGIAVISQK